MCLRQPAHEVPKRDIDARQEALQGRPTNDPDRHLSTHGRIRMADSLSSSSFVSIALVRVWLPCHHFWKRADPAPMRPSTTAEGRITFAHTPNSRQAPLSTAGWGGRCGRALEFMRCSSSLRLRAMSNRAERYPVRPFPYCRMERPNFCDLAPKFGQFESQVRVHSAGS